VLHPGDRVYVKVNGVTGQIYFGNLTTGEVVTRTVSIDNSNVGTSAEWIVEEAGDCFASDNACSYIPFDDPGFTSAYAYSTGMSSYVDLFNYRRFDLTDASGYRLAQPRPINTTTHGFRLTCCAR
jgi:hypothetical protein